MSGNLAPAKRPAVGAETTRKRPKVKVFRVKTGSDSGNFRPETPIFSNLPCRAADNRLFPEPSRTGEAGMAVAMTREGQTIRVEWLRRWYLRPLSLPFLAAALYFLWNAALIIR